MEKINAKYWKKIIWVNPKINKYYHIKVGGIYGIDNSNEDDTHWIFDKKTKNFLVYYKTKTILKLKEYLTREELNKRIDEVSSHSSHD